MKLPPHLFSHGPQLRDGATVLERINWLEGQAEWHRQRYGDALDRRDKHAQGWHFRQYRWFGREAHRLTKMVTR